jgi:hypothetical protein
VRTAGGDLSERLLENLVGRVRVHGRRSARTWLVGQAIEPFLVVAPHPLVDVALANADALSNLTGLDAVRREQDDPGWERIGMLDRSRTST